MPAPHGKRLEIVVFAELHRVDGDAILAPDAEVVFAVLLET
jgi:hypothetical protein